MAHQRSRNQKGMGTVELAITAIVGVLFACLAIDLGIVMVGNQLLDRATRDAARAAAGQRNANDARLAAQAALANHKADGFYVKNPALKLDEFVYQDFGGAPNVTGDPEKEPYVSVTATTEVTIPANLKFMDAVLGQGPMTTGKMPFRRTYHFPIVTHSLAPQFGGNN